MNSTAKLWGVICAICALHTPSAASAQPRAEALIQAAQAREEGLKNDPQQLRYRHHIEALVARWARAKRAATDPTLQRQAAEGELRALKLLARRSGVPSDRAAVEAAERALPAQAPAKRLRVKSMAGEGLSFSFSPVPPKIHSGTVPKKPGRGARLYFDIPLAAARGSLGRIRTGAPNVRRVRLGSNKPGLSRLVIELEPEVSLEDVSVHYARGQLNVRILSQAARAVLAGALPAPEAASSPETRPEPTRRTKAAPAAPTLSTPSKPEASSRRAKTARAQPVAEARTKRSAHVEPTQKPKTALPTPEIPRTRWVARARPDRPARAAPAPRLAQSSHKDTPKNPIRAAPRLTAEAPRRAQAQPPRPRLAVTRVVIDPGHGGEELGTVSPSGVREKDVNLAISKKLGALLEAEGVEVIYTRTRDMGVSLARRAEIANRSGAQLFISVHANANRDRKVHGVETYYLDTGSRRYNRRLAGRERRSADSQGQDLQLILRDLATRSTSAQSRRVAEHIQREIIRTLSPGHSSVRDLGVKKALFAVLLGTRMPAVLVETGFLSHRDEASQLAKASYQAELAEGIARGVAAHIAERQRVAREDADSLAELRAGRGPR